jgi:sigma-B regulation protein RsbU (phosphoserine phosphatase)
VAEFGVNRLPACAGGRPCREKQRRDNLTNQSGRERPSARAAVPEQKEAKMSIQSVTMHLSQPAVSLAVVEGSITKNVPVHCIPFTVGRRPEKDLVISDARVSRDHAVIVMEGSDYWLEDKGSKHGTFVNGERIRRHKLSNNDKIEFGAREGIHVIFNPGPMKAAATDLLSEISEIETGNASDLEKLSLLLDAARRLNSTSVLEDVLVTLLETTQKLTNADRAFVFLRNADGTLRLAAGRDAQGRALADDFTISRSILQEAADSGCEFLVTDTSRSDELALRNSIVAFELRTVICIPLCKTSMKERGCEDPSLAKVNVLGVLYLDSKFASREFSTVSHDVLRAIANDAAGLLENARLVQAAEEARLYQQELAIAASIQQGLMTVSIPDVPFAKVRARSVACKDVGGDFYDFVSTGSKLTAVVVDVSGKGISAAILASTLQGMIYSQLAASVPLANIAKGVNDFLCQKRLESKYATLVIAQLSSDGDLEIANCGHLPPLCVSNKSVRKLESGNFPVGLLPAVTYETVQFKLQNGDRMLLFSDGVTEAVNAVDDFFGDERLEIAAASENPFDSISAQLTAFCGNTPAADDSTLLEVTFTGQ